MQHNRGLPLYAPGRSLDYGAPRRPTTQDDTTAPTLATPTTSADPRLPQRSRLTRRGDHAATRQQKAPAPGRGRHPLSQKRAIVYTGIN